MREEPLTPRDGSPRLLFHSESYRAAIEEISSGLTHRDPIIVITGAMGTGKTMLCRMLVERQEARTVAATINIPPENSDDLLRRVLDAFGVLTNEASETIRASHDALLKTFQQFLRSLASLNATALIIFDEAHQLLPAVLEEIRLLFNVQIGVDHHPLQIILVGRPELEDLLARDDLHQLSLRISRRHRLAPLAPGEASVYFNHGLPASPIRRRVRKYAVVAATAAVVTGAALLWTIADLAGSRRTGQLHTSSEPDRSNAGYVSQAVTAGDVTATAPVSQAVAPAVSPRTESQTAEKNAKQGDATTPAQRPLTDPRMPDRSVERLLQNASALANQGNVKAVQQLRDEIVRRQGAAPVNQGELKSVLDQLEIHLAEARRRRLELDGRQLAGAQR